MITVLLLLSCDGPGADAPQPEFQPVPHPKGFGPISAVFAVEDDPGSPPPGLVYDAARQFDWHPSAVRTKRVDLDRDGREDWFAAVEPCTALGCLGAAYVPTEDGWCYAGSGLESGLLHKAPEGTRLSCLEDWAMIDGGIEPFPALESAGGEAGGLAGSLAPTSSMSIGELAVSCYALPAASVSVIHRSGSLGLSLGFQPPGAACGWGGVVAAAGSQGVSVVGAHGDSVVVYHHTEHFNNVSVYNAKSAAMVHDWMLFGEDAVSLSGGTLTIRGLGAQCEVPADRTLTASWRAGCLAVLKESLSRQESLAPLDTSALTALTCSDSEVERFGYLGSIMVIVTGTIDLDTGAVRVSDAGCSHGPS